MYRVVRRTGDIFGDEPHVCEFVCDTSDDVATLPTSIAEGTGGKSKYDNQKCSAGSTAIIATNSGSNSYILNNSDVWIAQSSGSGSGGSSETEAGPSIMPIGEDGMPYGDVIISEGIKSISSVSGAENRKSCFFANDKVNTVKLPSSMEILGDYGFKSSSLTDVIFNENSNVTEIGTSCFHNCDKLSSICIPKKVAYIGSYAFYGNDALTEVTFDADNLTIDKYAFSGCQNIVTLNWGSGIINLLSQSTFCNCNKLTVLNIPNNVISLGSSGTFDKCTGLISVLFEEGSPITDIPRNCFYQCTSLTDVVIHSGATTLGSAAFYNCSKMKHITLPNTLTSINCTAASYNNTFAGCSALETVDLEADFNCSISLDSCSVLTNAAEMLTKLKDLTGETAKTITFAKAVYDGLTSDEIAVATNKNWNVVSYGS